MLVSGSSNTVLVNLSYCSVLKYSIIRVRQCKTTVDQVSQFKNRGFCGPDFTIFSVTLCKFTILINFTV